MRLFSLVVLALLPCLSLAEKKPVTVDAVMEASKAARESAAPVTWAPSGSTFAWMNGDDLLIYELASKTRRRVLSLSSLEHGKSELAPEAWRNRRAREDTFQWLPDSQGFLLYAHGDLYSARLSGGSPVRLTATREAERDPQLSPDGRRVSFRRANDLYSMEIASKRVTRLTRDGSQTRWNGRLDWVYPEELDLGEAHWWSPDSRFIAYLQFDVSREPPYPHADLIPEKPVAEPQRYPKAGEPNADVRLGVVPATGGRTRWMNLGSTRDALFARVYWAPDSKSVLVERLNRIQNRLELVSTDIKTGAARVILREEDPHWVDFVGDLRFLHEGREFIRTSEQDGFRHIYLYTADGRQVRRLTEGEWEVTEIVGVDEAAARVYYLSKEASPVENQFFSVSLDGRDRRRITNASGTHDISMSPDCKHFLDTYSNLQSPKRRVVFRADGSEHSVFVEADRTFAEEYDLQPPQLVEVKASDGAVLYARLIRPAGFRPGVMYPAVVLVYGGPGSQDVVNEWIAPSLEQLLASRGFVVWQLDNRGTPGRGHQFETAVYRSFGPRQLEDQKAGIEHLISMGFVDPTRIGIHGWSFGGYMTLYSLLHAPNLFRAGVAGAPVTDWRNYDTIYTERYMGLPAENSDAYHRSSPVHYAGELRASLLLVHDFEDDNVLFQNTMQMASALQKAGKRFEMMVYPLKTHGTTGTYRAHFLDTLVSYFERNLKN